MRIYSSLLLLTFTKKYTNYLKSRVKPKHGIEFILIDSFEIGYYPVWADIMVDYKEHYLIEGIKRKINAQVAIIYQKKDNY